jgi:hypothetical protein
MQRESLAFDDLPWLSEGDWAMIIIVKLAIAVATGAVLVWAL